MRTFHLGTQRLWLWNQCEHKQKLVLGWMDLFKTPNWITVVTRFFFVISEFIMQERKALVIAPGVTLTKIGILN